MTDAITLKAHIIDLSNLERYEFQFNPDDITESSKSSLEEEGIPGSSHAQTSWSNRSNASISFTVRIVRLNEIEPEDIVKSSCEWLKSLEFPVERLDYDQSRAPFIQFVMGDLYDFPGLVENCTIKYPQLTSTRLLPEYADVSITIKEVSFTRVSMEAVRNRGIGTVRYLNGVNSVGLPNVVRAV
jgi:hypothetical protein